MRSEARLDMRDRDTGGEAGERAAERAGGVALHDEQIGTVREQRPNGMLTRRTCACGSGSPGQPRSITSKLPNPKSAPARPLC